MALMVAWSLSLTVLRFLWPFLGISLHSNKGTERADIELWDWFCLTLYILPWAAPASRHALPLTADTVSSIAEYSEAVSHCQGHVKALAVTPFSRAGSLLMHDMLWVCCLIPCSNTGTQSGLIRLLRAARFRSQLASLK